MMPENRSILFPHFRYSEASGACDGGIPVEKMILVKSAGHPGLLALASRLCPWSVWWGSSGARQPSPNLSKADPRHKHSMWAYNPVYHLRPKKHCSSTASNGTSFMFTLSIVWTEKYWWIERKRSRRQQGVERPKTYVFQSCPIVHPLKSVRIEKTRLVLISSCHKLTLNTLWTYLLKWSLRL